MKKIFYCLIALGVLVSLVLGGCTTQSSVPAQSSVPSSTSASPPAATTGEIKIASNATMSGTGAQWGIAFTRGAEVLIEKINKEGGLLVGGKRYTIKFLKYDNKRDPATAVENTKMLINTEKVNYIFHHGATCVIPALPITSEAKVISMDISVGAVRGWPYNFNILPFGKFRSGNSVKAFVKNFGIKTIAEINPDNDSGYACQTDDRSVAKAEGAQLLSDQFYPTGTTDFYPILTKSLAVKPDMLVIGLGSPGEVPIIIKQARELGWTGPIGMTQGSAGAAETLVQIAGKSAEGFVWSNPWHNDPKFWTKEEQDWATYWKANYSEPFMPDSFGGYKQIGLLTEAIKKADSLDADKISKALETESFTIMGWKIKFGATADSYLGRPRSLESPFYLMTIKDGKEGVSDMILPAGVEKVQ